jgi:hypothetical protein
MVKALIAALCLLAADCYGQYRADVFLDIKLGEHINVVDATVRSNWRVWDDADTGPFRTYFINCRVDSIYKQDAVRLYFYFMGDRLVAKEMRTVAGPRAMDSFRRMVAPVRQKFGTPAIDSASTGWGVDGIATFVSWNFPARDGYNMDRLDMATYKVIGRQGTIVIGAYANEYISYINIGNDYLHTRPVKYPKLPPPAARSGD